MLDKLAGDYNHLGTLGGEDAVLVYVYARNGPSQS